MRMENAPSAADDTGWLSGLASSGAWFEAMMPVTSKLVEFEVPDNYGQDMVRSDADDRVRAKMRTEEDMSAKKYCIVIFERK